MRMLLAALLAWLMPSRGTHRAATPIDVHALPLDEPLHGETARAMRDALRKPLGETAKAKLTILRAEDHAIVRPYLVAWEQQQERQRQRERRTAAVLATAGIDFPYGPQGRTA